MSEKKEIVEQDNKSVPMTTAQVKHQIQTIQQVLRDPNIMQKDVHYGVISGCGDKPTLLKPGAEKIMATFRLAPRYVTEDLSNSDERRYRISAELYSVDGSFVGSGLGECSSEEKKYKWRAAVCDEEYAYFESLGRARINFKKGYQGKSAIQEKQVRTDPPDIANTVLKMAKKRALIDAVLTATAASDIFAQDLEDMPEGIMPEAEKPAIQQPQEKKIAPQQAQPASNGAVVSPAQVKRYWAIFHNSGLSEEQRIALLSDNGFSCPEDITKDKYEMICNTMESQF